MALAAGRAPDVLDDRPVLETVRWAPSLGVDIALRLDAFALLMVALVSGVGVLVFLYSYRYFDAAAPALGGFSAALLGFAGAMLGLVLADNVMLLFTFWELTSVTSYLLIGTSNERAEVRAAARQALLITSAGGLAMLGGLVLLAQEAGTWTISGILSRAPEGPLVEAGLVLLLLGAFTKSAQIPFHAWLPGAMAAPTPVSAYLHSATMVKAGVYLIARFAPVFAGGSVMWRPLVLGVGLTTMLVGGYRALRQHDLKLLLALGTVSQLGLLVVLLGVGTAAATFAGCALLVAHGAYKAALFMGVGIIDHQAGTRDIRRLSQLGRALPSLFAVTCIAAASMAGLPPLVGFVAKEAAYESFLDAREPLVLVGIVAGSVLTVAYTARLLYGAFLARRDGPSVVDKASVARPTRGFVAPAAGLAVLSLVVGLAPGVVDELVNDAARSLDPAWEGSTLALWHGVNTALLLSVATLGAGLGLFLIRGPVERAQAALHAVPSAAEAFERCVSGVSLLATRVTGVVQNGSLPVYLSVIALTVVTLPGSALIHADVGGVPPVAASWVQTGIAVIVAAAAVGATLVGRRFAAVLFLGAVGYGVALLFVLQGAPDLALTQFLFETLALVVFVLVLRHLPDRFARQRLPLYGAFRLLVSVIVGVFVAAFALVAASARVALSVSEELLARALPEAGGRNVVNTILVDFRGLDTLGEITVLLVAAAGITSLVAASRAATTGREMEDSPDPVEKVGT